MKPKIAQNAGRGLEAREVDVHPEDPGDQRQREQDHA